MAIRCQPATRNFRHRCCTLSVPYSEAAPPPVAESIAIDYSTFSHFDRMRYHCCCKLRRQQRNTGTRRGPPRDQKWAKVDMPTAGAAGFARHLVGLVDARAEPVVRQAARPTLLRSISGMPCVSRIAQSQRPSTHNRRPAHSCLHRVRPSALHSTTTYPWLLPRPLSTLSCSVFVFCRSLPQSQHS